MAAYRITFEIGADNLAVFLREVAPHLGTMEVTALYPLPIPETTLTTPMSAPKPVEKKIKKPAKIRKSKVNDTILETLRDSPATIKEIKADLEKAGLSPSSISTGLTVLMRSKLVKRIEEGVYAHANYSANEPENAA
jgi:hypothetical protein